MEIAQDQKQALYKLRGLEESLKTAGKGSRKNINKLIEKSLYEI